MPHNMSVKRSLAELRELARVAASNHPMMNIAFQYPPAAAIDKAQQSGYTDHEAQSIRWLSIIKRDYGVEVFEEFCKESLRDRTKIRSEAGVMAGCISMLWSQAEIANSTIDFIAESESGVVKQALQNLPRGIRLSDVIRTLEEAAQKLRGIDAYVG
jgi:hypothetical protein